MTTNNLGEGVREEVEGKGGKTGGEGEGWEYKGEGGRGWGWGWKTVRFPQWFCSI